MTLRVDSIALRELRIPLRTPFRTSGGTTTERRVCLLEFLVGGATAVWSECVAGERPDYTGETIDTAWHVIETYAAPAVLDRDFESPQAVHAALSWIRGHPMARAAVEMGYWALAAERRGVSLAALLGGARDTVESGRTLGIDDDPGVMVERALAAVEAGYRKVKMKIEPGRDVEPVRRVREAIGLDVALSVDANGAYRLEDAEHLARLDAFGLTMLEQPLPARDFAGLAELQELLATPICLDESIETADDVHTMLALRAGRIVNIKPGRVGGFTESIAIHDLCVESGIPVWCGGMLETGLGRAYNAALASLPGFTLPGDLYPASSYLAEDLVAPPAPGTEGSVGVRPPAGAMTVPDAPGVGAVLDTASIEKLEVRQARVAAAAPAGSGGVPT